MDLVAWFAVWFAEVAACFWVLWWMVHADSRKVRRFEAEIRRRPPVPEQEFESHYFRCDRVPIEVAFRVRQFFSKVTGLPAQNILPDDDFCHDFRDNEGEVIALLEQEFGVTIPDAEACRMRATVRSVSMVVASVMRANPRPRV